jgi:ferredoxin
LKTGVNKSQFVKESFAAGVAHTPNPIESSTGSNVFELDSDAVVIGDRSKLSTPQTIIAVVDGETHTVPYKQGKTVLECLLEADLNPPYSCLDGACMACIGKVQEGAVYQNDMGILTDDNIEASECLTCQARPASSTIKINYEIF